MHGLLDLERHLVFYGAYHHNKVNIAIHVICVPLILFTFFELMSNYGPLIPLPDWLSIPYLDLNLGTIASLIWGGLYILLEPVAGTALAAICVVAAAIGNYLRNEYANTNWWALAVTIISWILQFAGHGVFEGRAPALFDNLFQAVFLAPLFVWLEVLFKLGYRPALRERVDKAVVKEVERFRREKGKKEI